MKPNEAYENSMLEKPRIEPAQDCGRGRLRWKRCQNTNARQSGDAVTEMERDLLVERTQSGLTRAKSEGKTLGRPAKNTAKQHDEIAALHSSGESISALARQFSVSRANILGIICRSA